MNMTLAEKGPHVPPPRLAPRFEKVSKAVQSWAGVISATHWSFAAPDEVDGADFYVGEMELGHIHLDGEVHVPFPAVLRKALIEAGIARRFQWSNGFVELTIKTAADSERAQWLFQLNYDRLHGATTAELLARVGHRARGAAHL